MKSREVTIYLIGFIFLLFGTGAIVNTLVMNTGFDAGLAPILWACYVCMILLGIGTIRKDSYLVLVQLNILAIPLLFWNFDFFFHIIFGKTAFGIVDYFFVSGPIVGKIISLQHLFSVPLSMYVLYLLKIKDIGAWKVSFAQMVILNLVTRFFSDRTDNINCIFEPCANFIPSAFYQITWFIGVLILVYLTNLVWVRFWFLRER